MTTPPQPSPSITYATLALAAAPPQQDHNQLELHHLVRSAVSSSTASTNTPTLSPSTFEKYVLDDPAAVPEDCEVSTIGMNETAPEPSSKRKVQFHPKAQFRIIQVWSDTYERVIQFQVENPREREEKTKPLDINFVRSFDCDYENRTALIPIITETALEDTGKSPDPTPATAAATTPSPATPVQTKCCILC
jgi:hypothetical protein